MIPKFLEELRALSWPDYDDVKMYDDLILDLFYTDSTSCKRTEEFRAFYGGHRKYDWPKEYIFKRYYSERYPDKTIRNWADIIYYLCVEHVLIEKPKRKHIDVPAIKPGQTMMTSRCMTT